MTVSDNKKPWLILRLVSEITRVRFYTLIDHFQSPDLVLGASAKEIQSLPGFDADLARKVLDAPSTVKLEQELELMAKGGVRLLTIEDDEYPENLKQSSFPPPLLYIRGRLEPNDRYSVAMVGSRHATQYGKVVAQQFSGRLAACGITVVSGLARGIDTQAHVAALSAGGRTLAVLGNGLSVCYPGENRKLADRVAESGALLTEYTMTTAPERYNFPERNHIIAALALGTVVVEAAQKSGALITANEALEENRFVFAVPGDINRDNSRGANALIQAGGRLVQRADDILSEMKGVLKGYLREKPDEEQAALEGRTSVPKPALTEDELYVLRMIRHEPTHFDALVAQVDPARMPVQRLSAVLLSLELKQTVKQMPGKLYTVTM
jgi:DNA processing protein